MMPPILYAERRGKIKALFILSVLVMAGVQAGFAAWLDSLIGVTLLLTVFFVSFNILEASLPSLVSRIAPASARGAAIGVYNTTQALGLAAGGLVGGWLAQHHGNVSVFVFGLVLVALWLLVAAGMKPPAPRAGQAQASGSVQN
jgi:predicted MFS family arabinose efflux permease